MWSLTEYSIKPDPDSVRLQADMFQSAMTTKQPQNLESTLWILSKKTEKLLKVFFGLIDNLSLHDIIRFFTVVPHNMAGEHTCGHYGV